MAIQKLREYRIYMKRNHKEGNPMSYSDCTVLFLLEKIENLEKEIKYLKLSKVNKQLKLDL